MTEMNAATMKELQSAKGRSGLPAEVARAETVANVRAEIDAAAKSEASVELLERMSRQKREYESSLD